MVNEKLKETLKKRYDSDYDSVISEVQEDEKVEVKQGKSWTKSGVYSTYNEAAKHRDRIVKKSPEYDTKIKRCGAKQSKFKVLKRKNKELAKKTKKSRSKDEKGSTVDQ